MENTVRLENWKGGGKHMWLKQHRAEILDYLKEHGTGATMAKYRMTFPTLESLATGDPASVLLREVKGIVSQDPMLDTVLEAKRQAEAACIVAERARQANADLRREIRELKQAFGMFQQSIAEQIAGVMVKAITQNLTVPENMVQSGKNPLALEVDDGQRHIGKRGPKRLGYTTPISEPGGEDEIEDLLLELD